MEMGEIYRMFIDKAVGAGGLFVLWIAVESSAEFIARRCISVSEMLMDCGKAKLRYLGRL